MSKLYKSFKKSIHSDFLKNILVLISGTFLAQLITFGSVPLITRLYTPENFGILGLFSAFVTVTSDASSFSYEKAILLPKDNNDAATILFLSILLTIIISFFILIFILFCKPTITILIGNQEFVHWLWLLPLGILFRGVDTCFRFWRARFKEFKSSSLSKVSEASFSSMIKIFIGYTKGAYSGGLLAGFLVGIFASLITLFISPSRFLFKNHLSSFSLAKINTMAKKYKSFPLFATWNRLLISISQNLIIFLFSFLFSPAIVGYYSLSKRILGQPVQLVSQSVQNVYFQKAASDLSNGLNIKESLKKTTLALIITGLPPFIFLTIFSEVIFKFVFGQQWNIAGIYAGILSPMFFALYISSPAATVYEVLLKQKYKLILNITMTVVTIVTILISYIIFKDPEIILILFVSVSIFFRFILIILAFRLVRNT